jgi:hypothetical protein
MFFNGWKNLEGKLGLFQIIYISLALNLNKKTEN